MVMEITLTGVHFFLSEGHFLLRNADKSYEYRSNGRDIFHKTWFPWHNRPTKILTDICRAEFALKHKIFY